MVIDREYMGMVPLRSVVRASIIDSYGDINRQEQRNTHWAARGLRKLYNESLPRIPCRVLIKVNKGSNTAPLPCDFKLETFVGYILDGEKVPIPLNYNLTNDCSISKQIEKECPRCKQDKAICDSLEIIEITRIIKLDGVDCDETITKKLYPNGDYYMETSTPVINNETSDVEYFPHKEFIVNFKLNPCGCLANTEANIENVKYYCDDTYKKYYASCDCTVAKMGYRIFDGMGDNSVIQLSGYYGDMVYLEYEGFMTKKDGVYMVPEIAFETLVEWTKWKSVQGKENKTRYDKDGYFESYVREKRNMEKILGRVSLQSIIDATRALPVFEFDIKRTDYIGEDRTLNRTETINEVPVYVPSDVDPDTFIILND